MTSNTQPAPDQLTVLPRCFDSVDVLLTDPDFLLIEKPAGLLSVPGRNPANHDCVLSRLQLEYPSVSIVHRLDFDTSGIMVVALNKIAHGKIARQFQERETYKLYYARVAGRPEPGDGVIDLPIMADPLNRPKYKVDEQGKSSITRYKFVSYDQQTRTSLLALEPLTGRSHQLRLHLAEIGCPILGCAFYADAEVRGLSSRLLLHASELRFQHPQTGCLVKGTSARPF
ncbi:RluA family pseudouridine synthase [Gilvimarinus sp. SDUM040013]|uniref:Dual-specificity RNA pseudouridine synthase RluA n=1 Tax=Gilvimarinus gilvus TaxID=3058038 RepID=A0ABU4RU03_9GAMM|nr:RluA family pseudouridine synthase [Gilvimarinus sp. SDUM040013]MDO3384993.1 RluA family pseudouridine synthase [Gilvimarinus sp. SDUM040013]MDX6848368.1 RluA family pseudouridine synthase [Gilvimarinus sp. SDUM040013]